MVRYVSAATMLGVEVAEQGDYFYTEMVDALRMYGAAPPADTEELWRSIAFSILITNVDDHLRSHDFLHGDHGQWRLAPAFDVNPFPDRLRELKTWVSEDAGPEATIDALMSALPYFRIAVPRACAILRDVEHAVSQWRAVGRRLGMTKRELDAFADAFEHEQRSAARHHLE
jgi:serine/threonine-protein kinase HipA